MGLRRPAAPAYTAGIVRKAWLLLAVAIVASPVRGQIYAWRDADGVTHFTNLEEEIPASERANAREVVGAAWSRAGLQGEAEPAPPVREERGAATVVVPALATRPAPVPPVRVREVAGGNVQIQGPLAVAVADAPVFAAAVPAVFPGFVTTAFDRGRSRHRTLRLLAEEALFPELVWPVALAVPSSPCPRPWLTFAGGPRYSCLEWPPLVLR